MIVDKSICKYLKQDIDDNNRIVCSCEEGVPISDFEDCRSCPLYKARYDINKVGTHHCRSGVWIPGEPL